MAQPPSAPVVGAPSGPDRSVLAQAAEQLAGAEQVAADVGADDVFVFRRVGHERWVHVGGVGRGVGWAGLIDVHLRNEPLLARAVTTGKPARLESHDARRVVGPYYARGAVVVPLPPDSVVVLGAVAGPLPRLRDRAWAEAATVAIGHVHAVSPAKQLADELELLHALRELSAGDHASLAKAREHVTRTAASALSCELGLLYWIETDEVVAVALGWDLPGSADERRAALRNVASQAGSFPVCAQDITIGSPLGPPFDHAAGCRSAYLLGIGEPRVGLLVLIHTDAVPRGFTTLCQELGAKLASASEPILRAAANRERLHHEIDLAYQLARRDPLTGLGNRRAWDEALSGEQHRMPRSGPASVIFADVVGLKRVNDTCGLIVGDEMIRTAAVALAAAVRDGDTLARIGGDEFALLLPGTDAAKCRLVVERIEPLVADAAVEATGVPLSLSLGWATADASHSLEDAVAAADIMLCEAKRARRSASGGT